MSDLKQPGSTGFVLSLRDLEQHFSAISHGDHHWSYLLTPRSVHTGRAKVTVTYSNPVYGSLPNAISFHFPVLYSHCVLFEPDENTFICLHPELAKAGDHGLYFEDGEVETDCLYDWEVFWSPILAGLGRAASTRRSKHDHRSNPRFEHGEVAASVPDSEASMISTETLMPHVASLTTGERL